MDQSSFTLGSGAFGNPPAHVQHGRQPEGWQREPVGGHRRARKDRGDEAMGSNSNMPNNERHVEQFTFSLSRSQQRRQLEDEWQAESKA
jgi:hypothetical protein